MRRNPRIEIAPRGPEELRAESAEKVLPEVLSGTQLGVPEKVPKNCRKKCTPPLFLAFRERFRQFFGAFFRHSQPGPRKHFGEQFFGTFGPELFGAPLAGRRNLNPRNPFNHCTTPQARDQNINCANLHKNEIVQPYRDSRCSGASPI